MISSIMTAAFGSYSLYNGYNAIDMDGMDTNEIIDNQEYLEKKLELIQLEREMIEKHIQLEKKKKRIRPDDDHDND